MYYHVNPLYYSTLITSSSYLLQDLLDTLVMVDSEEKKKRLLNYQEAHLFGLRYVYRDWNIACLLNFFLFVFQHLELLRALLLFSLRTGCLLFIITYNNHWPIQSPACTQDSEHPCDVSRLPTLSGESVPSDRGPLLVTERRQTWEWIIRYRQVGMGWFWNQSLLS